MDAKGAARGRSCGKTSASRCPRAKIRRSSNRRAKERPRPATESAAGSSTTAAPTRAASGTPMSSRRRSRRRGSRPPSLSPRTAATKFGSSAETEALRAHCAPKDDQLAVCLSSDTAKAPCDVELSGTLEVGGSVPIVAHEKTRESPRRVNRAMSARVPGALWFLLLEQRQGRPKGGRRRRWFEQRNPRPALRNALAPAYLMTKGAHRQSID